MDYLEEHCGLTFVVCPESVKKGFKTWIPTLPSVMFNHLKRHHRDVLKRLGVTIDEYSPVIWSHKDNYYSTPALERAKKAKKRYVKKKTSFTRSNPSARKKTIDLKDASGKSVDALSVASLASEYASSNPTPGEVLAKEKADAKAKAKKKVTSKSKPKSESSNRFDALKD